MTRDNMVNEQAAILIKRDHAEIEKLGFPKPRTYFDLGAQAASWTTDNYSRVQREFEKLPLSDEGLTTFADQVAREDRVDYPTLFSDMHMEDSGALVTPWGDFTPELDGYKAIMQIVQNNASAPYLNQYTSTAPADVRAWNFNRWAASLKDKIVLRTRKDEHKAARDIYTVVTPVYEPHNPDVLARQLRRIFDKEEGSRVDIRYDGKRTVIRVVWFNYHKIEQAGCGDVFRFGVEIETADDRTSAVWVRLLAYINQCLNYIIVDESLVNVGRRVHKQQKLSMASSVQALVRRAKAEIAPFLEHWNAAAKDNLIEEADKSQPADVFKKLVERGYGKVAGWTTDQLVARYMKAWQEQPGYSRLHFVNALTKAAHTNTWASPWVQNEVETQASQLVYVHRVFA